MVLTFQPLYLMSSLIVSFDQAIGALVNYFTLVLVLESKRPFLDGR